MCLLVPTRGQAQVVAFTPNEAGPHRLADCRIGKRVRPEQISFEMPGRAFAGLLGRICVVQQMYDQHLGCKLLALLAAPHNLRKHSMEGENRSARPKSAPATVAIAPEIEALSAIATR